MEEASPKKRTSLRNSVLKRPNRNLSQSFDPTFHHEGMPSAGSLFRNLDPFGFEGMSPFGSHFDEMMSRFFNDFRPESFADSRFYQEDRDLDEDISKQGLDKTLRSRPDHHSPNTFMGISYSESTVTRPDGTVERRISHTNSHGNVETNVTITHPDGTVESVTDDSGSRDSRNPTNNILSEFRGTEEPIDDQRGLFRIITDEFKNIF
uniref:HCLS1-associated protein X-1-like n=1 Tax=Styela clava TaxID=7725 RepID=UPI001939759C|nr:HCLS1-associated protein X-1-like [Styela clava]